MSFFATQRHVHVGQYGASLTPLLSQRRSARSIARNMACTLRARLDLTPEQRAEIYAAHMPVSLVSPRVPMRKSMP